MRLKHIKQKSVFSRPLVSTLALSTDSALKEIYERGT